MCRSPHNHSDMSPEPKPPWPGPTGGERRKARASRSPIKMISSLCSISGVSITSKKTDSSVSGFHEARPSGLSAPRPKSATSTVRICWVRVRAAAPTSAASSSASSAVVKCPSHALKSMVATASVRSASVGAL